MRRVLSLLAVASLVLGMGPVRAFHEDDIPLVASGADLPSGWVSFTITTDGSMFAMDIGADGYTGPAQLGFAQYSAAGAAQGAFIFTSFPRKAGAQLDLLGPDSPVHVDAVEDEEVDGLFALGLTFNDLQFGQPLVGTLKVLLWWAGEGAFFWQFRAHGGTTIDAQLAAPRAYLYASDDFANTAYVQAHGYAQRGTTGTPGVGGHVQVQGDLPLEVQNALVGFYSFGLTSAGSLSVTTPAGERSCNSAVVASSGFVGGSSCFFLDLTGPSALGPGDYVLHATSAGAGLSGAFEDIWFGGADAALPA